MLLMTRRLIHLLVGLCLMAAVPAIQSHAQAPAEQPAAQIVQTASDAPDDAAIESRISAIFSEIDSLKSVEVDVREGVVTLSGGVSNSAAATRAIDIAGRLVGVVTVEDKIDRTLDIEGNVSPIVDTLNSRLKSYYRALPLLGLGLALSRDLARSLGGDLTLEQSDSGAAFRLRI